MADGPTEVDIDSLDRGDGDSYIITNASELQAMNQSLDSDYELGRTINATNTSDWYSGDGFKPIGNDTDPFAGTFDGKGYAIENLTVDRGSENYVGLFGNASQGSTIGNVTLRNATVNGSAHVGTLVGETSGDVYDAHSSGNVTTELSGGSPTVDKDSDSARVGGLVGLLTESGTVRNTVANVNVTGTNTDTLLRVGGLVGYSFGEIRDSKATGDVEGLNGVGGLVGRNAGHIENATATGNVTGLTDNTVPIEGTYSIGGLAGYNGPDNSGTGTITQSHATGTVSAVDGNQVGGLIGSNKYIVNKSFATGTVAGDIEVGGFVGENQEESIADSYANGTVADGNTDIGGFVGENDATIERSYAVVDVPTGAGGFVGTDNGGTVTAGYWDREATGEETSADGQGLSTFEMTSLVAKDYMEFDYDETWNATKGYPRLAWENADEPDPYPTAAPGTGEVWLLNDSDTGYYHNYSIDGSGDVQWLGEVVASPGSDNSSQLIEIAAGNTTADYDTLVVGPGAYNLTTDQVNLTTDTGANLTRVFSHNGSDETEILRASDAGFTAYEESVLRVDNPAAATLEIGDSGTFDANGDGGFYIESDEGGAEDSPLIGVYDAASQYNLTVTNTTFGMWTNHGDTILLEDSETAFALELDLVSHSGAVINASAASGLSVTNSTITEENDPRGTDLDGEGISFLKLDAGGLDDVTVENVTITGATEATTVDGVVDITSLAMDASVTMDDLEIANTSQDAINVATDIASLSLSGLNLTDIGTRGLTITENVSTVTITDSEVTNTSATSIFTETTANVSEYNLTGTTITDSGGRGIYLRGTIGNATVENNTLTDSTLTPIDFGVNAGQSTPFEIFDNHVDGSGVSNSLIVIGSNAQVNITGNTLLNSGLRGIYVDAADAVIADTYIENSSRDRADAHGIELDTGATNASVRNTTIIDSNRAGIYVHNANNVTIRNATVETTGEYGIRFADGSENGELVESTITNTSDDALAVKDVTVAVTGLDLGSGTVSANVTDTNLNRTANVASNGDYQSGDDAIRLAKASGRVENLTLSYNTSAFDIDQQALSLWRRAPTWNSEPSIVDTDEQVAVATEAFDSEVGVLTTFASNVSITANDTTVNEGEAGTIDLNATNGADGLENVTLNISDAGGLDGISDGDTVTTNANGEANVSFQETTEGTYAVVFRWTNNTIVSDTATVTVEATGGGGGGGGRNTGGGGSTPLAPAIDQTIVDDGTTDVTGGRSGDVVAINDETLRRSSSIDGLDTIAVDGLSIELATDRDFWIDVETYERGEEEAVDSAADSDESGDIQDDESADPTASSITASFERETETVSVGYVTVTHNLEPEDIADVTFDFSVRDDYLDELDVDPEDVELYRQAEGWSSLSTDYRERSGGRYRFEADSPGFSSFAIGTNAPLSIVINGTLDQTEIEAGETAAATATVNNRGENPVTHTVDLTADGETVASETVTVGGGEITTIPLAFEPEAGVYELAVDDVSIGSLTVTAEEPPVPWWLPIGAIALVLLVGWSRRRQADEDETTATEP